MLDVISLKKIKDVDEKHALKSTTLEKELTDYKNTLAGININQEAKQSASGYGVVSLPKNCANGQVSAVVRGLTHSNILGSGGGAEKIFSANVEFFNSITPIPKLPIGKYILIYNITETSATSTRNTPWVQYIDATRLFESAAENYNSTAGRKIWKINATKEIEQVGWWANRPTSDVKIREFMLLAVDDTEYAKTDAELLVKYSYINGTKSTVSAVRVKSESADKKQTSMLYLNAGQPLRSLLNGTKDEVSEGKLNKRINVYTLQVSDIKQMYTAHANLDWAVIQMPSDVSNTPNINSNVFSSAYPNYIEPLDSALNIGKMAGYSSPNKQVMIGFAKGTTLAQAQQALAGTTLIYQLATPVISDIQTSGSLFGYPSGTVYVENVLPVAGVYKSTGIAVTYPDFPIASIEKISKIDPATGVETEVPVTSAVIASDKLSFTHPSLVAGDIIFFTYYHAVEGTVGEATIGYYDSRYTIKDSSNGKYYQWKIVSNNGVPSITLVEV
jgi:hypothetical protein